MRDPQVVVEKRDAGTAVIAASFRSWDAETHTVRYDMVREGGAWKIDDIHTKSDSKADNYQWSTARSWPTTSRPCAADAGSRRRKTVPTRSAWTNDDSAARAFLAAPVCPNLPSCA